MVSDVKNLARKFSLVKIAIMRVKAVIGVTFLSKFRLCPAPVHSTVPLSMNCKYNLLRLNYSDFKVHVKIASFFFSIFTASFVIKKALFTTGSHDTKPAMLGRKLHSGNSKAKESQALLLLLLLLFSIFNTAL